MKKIFKLIIVFVFIINLTSCSEVLDEYINIKTGNNAIISGANITAESQTQTDKDGNILKDKDGNPITTGGNLTANIGNNLNIESLQDTLYSKSNSNSANFGIGNSSISGGYSKEKSYTDSAWVNNQTTLIGNNNVNINVANNTDVKGSVINSNSNNLTLNTKELNYSDINDFYTSETKGSSFSTTIGSDPDKGKANIAPMGSTTIGLTSTGSEKEQETRATIGNGSIVITGKEVNEQNDNLDLIRDLNRDNDKSQQITKDMITGALDGSMTIDNRIFTPSGWSSIGSDVKNFGGNTKKSIIGAGKSANIIVETTYKVGGVIGETIGGETGKAVFDNLLKYTIGTTVGGVASAFGEDSRTTDKYLTKDGYINSIVGTEAKNYVFAGILTGDKGAEDIVGLHPNSIVRVNETDGAIGDLVEAGITKALGWTNWTSDFSALGRMQAEDLNTIITTNNNVVRYNTHSEGTIGFNTGLNVFENNYLAGIKKNDVAQQNLNNLQYNVLGYAVYKNDVVQNLRDIGIIVKPKENLNFDKDDRDPVQKLTSPTLKSNPFSMVYDAIKNRDPSFGVDSHGLNNSFYDKYFKDTNLIDRQKIDQSRGITNTFQPENQNNKGINYVIPYKKTNVQ